MHSFRTFFMYVVQEASGISEEDRDLPEAWEEAISENHLNSTPAFSLPQWPLAAIITNNTAIFDGS